MDGWMDELIMTKVTKVPTCHTPSILHGALVGAGLKLIK
jgi:hypothetical protein